jgi:biotin/methionine sulfoxide reductase
VVTSDTCTAATRNAVRDFIPVAHFFDVLIDARAQSDFNGDRLIYPDTRLAYWAGGSPFHHQDLNRL